MSNRLTLCICTYRRPAELRRALSSLQKGGLWPFEVLVSDDGHSDEVRQIAQLFGAKYQRGPGRGLGPNRNACIDTASGTHIAFIDDDVEVSSDFVEVATDLASDSIVTGWEMNWSTGRPIKVAANNPGFLGYHTRPPAAGGPRKSIVINSTVFPATIFKNIKFSEWTRYGNEELDIARQAVAAGVPIIYSDNLWVHHRPATSNRDAQAVEVDASRIYLTARAYLRYERRPAKAAFFLILAPAHLLVSELKRRRDVRGSLRSLTLAMRMAAAESRTKHRRGRPD